MPERAETPCPGRVASGSLDLSPFLSHMQKLNLSFTAKPGWYDPDHPLVM